MAATTEQWLPIARQIVKGVYLPADIPLFDKEAEAQALAEWLASHAPTSAECGEHFIDQFGKESVCIRTDGKHECHIGRSSEAAAQPQAPLSRYLKHTYEFSTQEDAVKAMTMGKEMIEAIRAEIEHNDH